MSSPTATRAETSRPLRRLARNAAHRFRLVGLVFGIFLALLTLSACGSESATDPAPGGSAPAGKIQKLTVQLAPSLGPSSLLLGIDRGTFKDKGLEIETKPYAPDSSVPLVLNGQTEIGFNGIGAIITARSKGLPLKIIGATAIEGGTADTNSTAVVASKASGVTAFKELAGKKVGVNALGGDAQAHAAGLIDADGGDSQSVQWQAIPFPGQVAALKGGQVDAILTVAPFTSQAVADGNTYLGPFSPEGYGAGVWFTSDSYLEKNGETVTKFLAALQEANDYSNAHRDETLAKLAKAADLPVGATKAFPKVTWGTKLDPEVMNNAVTLMKKYGFITEAPALEDLVYTG